MPKVALFLSGILLGVFITLYHIRSERNREIDLGPQIGQAAADNDEEWTPCEDMAQMQPLYPDRPR
jgi:hypothetical protein